MIRPAQSLKLTKESDCIHQTSRVRLHTSDFKSQTAYIRFQSKYRLILIVSVNALT
jgi:hypothetical protein